MWNKTQIIVNPNFFQFSAVIAPSARAVGAIPTQRLAESCVCFTAPGPKAMSDNKAKAVEAKVPYLFVALFRFGIFSSCRQFFWGVKSRWGFCLAPCCPTWSNSSLCGVASLFFTRTVATLFSPLASMWKRLPPSPKPSSLTRVILCFSQTAPPRFARSASTLRRLPTPTCA
jgi:hypothetical protein